MEKEEGYNCEIFQQWQFRWCNADNFVDAMMTTITILLMQRWQWWQFRRCNNDSRDNFIVQWWQWGQFRWCKSDNNDIVLIRAVESESREVGKSLKIGKNWIKSAKSDLISYPTFWQKCQNAINCHKQPKCLHFGSGSCIRVS